MSPFRELLARVLEQGFQVLTTSSMLGRARQSEISQVRRIVGGVPTPTLSLRWDGFCLTLRAGIFYRAGITESGKGTLLRIGSGSKLAP